MIPSAQLAALRNARHLVVFTGAGVSAESGIPTFRDSLTGLWQRFDAATLATPEAYEQDPALVWGWYEWRRMQVLKAQPNAAHRAIAALVQQVPRLTLVTQNVDDLHERAGSSDVIHLHGSLHHPRCVVCSRQPSKPLPPPDEPQEGRRLPPPRCEYCDGKLRPGVVWFGESMPGGALDDAFAAARHCDVLISVGTSGVVYPAAEMPERAWRAGATVIHVNPQPNVTHSEREYALGGSAGEVLPQLFEEAFGL
ncbi:SIR2 family NAD-dependent protein deacylase [Stutzerimonas balearica]|uniref:SIR2 family NAD-dependent protein deacylase n=1 Tax=Stutzerimonas balearica TaxID=74829 RepID=UPI000C54B1B8|nr:NAD-dependent deacylase [Pseudomonas sp.]